MNPKDQGEGGYTPPNTAWTNEGPMRCPSHADSDKNLARPARLFLDPRYLTRCPVSLSKTALRRNCSLDQGGASPPRY